MRGGSRRSDPADRRLGWLLAILVLPSGAWWVPQALAQAGAFARWWQIGGWLLAASFLFMAAAGLRLPMPALRALWVATPVLLIALQLLSFAALQDAADPVLPWVRWFGAPAVCLLVLCLPAWIAVAVSVASSLSIAFSAWVFTGAVPPGLFSDIPLGMSGVVFVALVIAMREWLRGLHEAEARARAAAEHRARSTAEAKEQAWLSRFVHDEVLSVLTAASLFDGEPPRELRAEAAAALRAFAVDPLSGRSAHPEGTGHSGQPGRSSHGERQRIAPEPALDRLRARLARLAPRAFIAIKCDDAPVDAEALAALGDAAGEAVRNAVRHARAGRIAVLLSSHEGVIRIRVADDGIGFDPEALPQERFGIRESIVARVAEAGGSARIDSAPGEGTEVELSWRR